MIDALPVTEAAKAKGAEMENLRPKAEMADVEKPKSETKITKNLDETEENSQANLKDDRSSNFATNKDKDINDFNHTTKIKNKITHKSALDEMTQQTEHHEARKEGEERQASTPVEQPKALGKVPEKPKWRQKDHQWSGPPRQRRPRTRWSCPHS